MHIEKTENGFQLRSDIIVPESRSRVFEFFSNAHQLEKITPPTIRFSVLTPKPIKMKVGTLIDYRLKIHGLPLRWQSRITAWEPETRFVDEQVKGPYKRWHHEHIFEDHEGGTRIIDIVNYDVPFSFLVHPLFVRPDLEKIFKYRCTKIMELMTDHPHS